MLGLRTIFGDQCRDRQPQQHPDRHVDGEMQIKSGLVEHRPIAQRRHQRMLRKLDDAGFVDIGMKTAGQQHAKLRMVHARQRLGAGKAFALEIDLGLVPDFEPMIAQRLGDRDARPRVGDRPALRTCPRPFSIGSDRQRASFGSDGFMLIG